MHCSYPRAIGQDFRTNSCNREENGPDEEKRGETSDVARARCLSTSDIAFLPSEVAILCIRGALAAATCPGRAMQ